MKKSFMKFFMVAVLCLGAFLPAKATHIVGGDITVKSLGGNNFEITLTLLFDCINGNPAAFDPSITVGIFDKVTNAKVDSLIIPFTDSVQLVIGDACYTPPNLCVRKQRYIGTISIPNNPNGYYLSWHRCCRNSIITNIVNPGGSGNVFYAEIPDPALQNSTPTFSVYPDAYMCQTFANKDTFTATDIDGDSLVYSLSDPFDCASSGICGSAIPSPIPPTASGPYSTIPWQTPYSPTNIMGDPAMAINSQNGIISTTPPTLGVFVFCVKVEEFNKVTKVKLGEIRREVQYSVLVCNFTTAAVSGPNPICLGKSTTLTGTGGTPYSWSTGATTVSIIVQPTAAGTYTYVVTAGAGSCMDTAIAVITVNPLPIVVAAGDATICPGNSTTLSATGTSTSYSWSPAGTLANPNTSNPTATPGGTTSYIVVGTDSKGCKNQDTALVTMGIQPQALFTSSQSLDCDGINVQLNDASLNALSWYWQVSNGVTSSDQNTSITLPYGNNIYTITLLVTNPPCMDSITGTISTGGYFSIEPANVFTPNGDGLNDCFRPRILGGIGDSLSECIYIEIFDRWGVQVFESTDTQKCWDGKTKSGSKAKDGTYYYIAKLNETVLKGFVELLRNKK